MANFKLPTVENWQSLQHDLIMLYDGVVPDGGNRSNFSEPFFTLWLIRHGQVEIVDPKGETLCIHEGNWLLIPPFFEHSQSFSFGAKILSTHFFAQWPTGVNLFSPAGVLSVGQQEWPDVEESLLELLSQFYNPLDPVPLDRFLRIECRLLRFLGVWYENMLVSGIRENGPDELDHRVSRAISVLDRTEYCGRIPYRLLQKECAASRTHINRLFKDQLGKTPRQYLDDRILQKVIRQLVLTRKPITDICYDFGFLNTSHFSRWFKKLTNTTPIEYRRVHNQHHSPSEPYTLR